MIEDLNLQLNQLNKKILSKEIVLKRIEEIGKELVLKNTEIVEFRKVLQKEKKDVYRLKNSSIYSLFISIIGDKQEKFTKEQSEYMDAKAKYDYLVIELDELRKDKRNQKKKLKTITALEEKKLMLLNEKKILVLDLTDDLSDSINDLSRKENRLNKAFVELKEALSEGKSLDKTLSKLLKVTESAEKWVTFNVFTRKHSIESLIKNDLIKEGNRLIVKTKFKTYRFVRELNDTRISSKRIKSNFSKTLASDMFYNNIFNEHGVRSDIESAIDKITVLSEELSIILDEIKDSIKKVKKEQKATEIELRDLISGY